MLVGSNVSKLQFAHIAVRDCAVPDGPQLPELPPLGPRRSAPLRADRQPAVTSIGPPALHTEPGANVSAAALRGPPRVHVRSCCVDRQAGNRVCRRWVGLSPKIILHTFYPSQWTGAQDRMAPSKRQLNARARAHYVSHSDLHAALKRFWTQKYEIADENKYLNIVIHVS
jgi:hypothetical protein